jgi:hypothetical protein
VQTSVKAISLRLQDGETREVLDKLAWKVSVAIPALNRAGEAVQERLLAQRSQLEV